MNASLRRLRLALANLILGGIIALGSSPVHAESGRKLDGIVLVISDGTSLELITAARDYALGPDGKLAWINSSHGFGADVFGLGSGDRFRRRRHGDGARHQGHQRRARAGNSGFHLRPGQHSRSGQGQGLVDRGAKRRLGDRSDPGGLSRGASQPGALRRIADNILDQFGKRVDIVLGGGYQWFSDRSADPAVTYKDNQLTQVQKNAEKREKSGVAYFDDWNAFVAAKKGDKPVLGTFFPDVFPFYADGSRTLRLRDMVSEAVKFLKAGGKPYLLVAEAGLPDKACHANNASGPSPRCWNSTPPSTGCAPMRPERPGHRHHRSQYRRNRLERSSGSAAHKGRRAARKECRQRTPLSHLGQRPRGKSSQAGCHPAAGR